MTTPSQSLSQTAPQHSHFKILVDIFCVQSLSSSSSRDLHLVKSGKLAVTLRKELAGVGDSTEPSP